MAQPRRRTVAQRSAGTEIGRTGLNYDPGGVILEEVLPNLAGRKAIDAYREMRDNDPMIGAILFAIENLARQSTWSVEPHPDGDQADADFVTECMNDMSHSWGDFIAEAFTMLPYGWSLCELVYKQRTGPATSTGRMKKKRSSKYNDGRIGWARMPFRSQDSLDRWEFDEDGDLTAMVQMPPPDYTYRTIPMEKALLFRTTSFKNNPEGRSILRNAYRPWFFKKHIEEIEGVGMERDLAGYPVLRVPASMLSSEATKDEKATLEAFKRLASDMRRDRSEYALLPSDRDDKGNRLYDLELLSAGGKREFDTNAIIGRYDQRIAMTVLADFILLGHEQVGSYALSSDKTNLFSVALGTFLDAIEDVLNRFAVPRLFELNGLPLDTLPTIKHGDIEAPNLTELAGFIASLTTAGIPLLPDPAIEAYLREIAGLPAKDPDAAEAAEKAAHAATQQTIADAEDTISEIEAKGTDTGPDPINDNSGPGPVDETANAKIVGNAA